MNIEETRLLAKDETTSPETLRELATSDDVITRQNVVMNSNTPTKILLALSNKFPNQVMNNPVVPLLLLENPHIFTCKITFEPIDFPEFCLSIRIEIKRLGWREEKVIKYLLKNYAQRSILHLKDSECMDYLSKLEQLKN